MDASAPAVPPQLLVEAVVLDEEEQPRGSGRSLLLRARTGAPTPRCCFDPGQREAGRPWNETPPTSRPRIRSCGARRRAVPGPNADARSRGTTWGTKLTASERTQLNLEHPSELRWPRFGLRTRYRTQEVAGSSPASSTGLLSSRVGVSLPPELPETVASGIERALGARGSAGCRCPCPPPTASCRRCWRGRRPPASSRSGSRRPPVDVEGLGEE
jgi:hypothetical protein